MPALAFEDIIINSTEKKAGEPGDKKNFISMSHITPHNLTISKWGVKEPFSDNKLIVKKGDVLFIWRDPADHRVAISPIDGLFTGFGMVFRPKTDVILPEFLPYFISSDTFINKAASMAVGTKSKRANWKELRKTVFDIPSIDEQRKILDVIYEMNALSDAYDSLTADLNLARRSFFYEHILSSAETAQMSLGELMYLQTKTEKVESIENIKYTTYDEIVRNAAMRRPKNSTGFYAYRLHKDQMLAHRIGFCNGSFSLVPEAYDNYLIPAQIQVFNIYKNIIIPRFLYYMISRQSFVASLEKMDLSTENWNYTFSKHKIAVPSVSEQQRFLDFYDRTEKSLGAATKCKAQTYEALQSLLCEHISAE